MLIPPLGVHVRRSSEELAIDDEDVVAAAQFIRDNAHLPIKVTDVDEWGVLESSVPFFFDFDLDESIDAPPDASKRYAEAINAQLARSKNKSVYIYVHGYKVVYENPVLVSSELWHFLGYDGVFIAYAWPSTPSKFAYIKDSILRVAFLATFVCLSNTLPRVQTPNRSIFSVIAMALAS